MNAGIFILDEVTSALDQESQKLIRHSLGGLARTRRASLNSLFVALVVLYWSLYQRPGRDRAFSLRAGDHATRQPAVPRTGRANFHTFMVIQI